MYFYNLNQYHQHLLQFLVPVLLKKQLCDEPVTTISNKICDHEWECGTISTLGITYICKKCGVRIIYSPNESDIVTI